MSNAEFSKFILTLRKEKGITQTDLAKKMNVTDKAVSKWERGINYPDIVLIPKLAAEFDVTILELLNGERKMKIESDKSDEVNDAVVKTLDFSKQLIKNQKRNYITQSLILIIVFLLVIVGYQGYDRMFGSFGVSISDLTNKIADLQTQIDQIVEKSNEVNIYGNGIYYCYIPEATFDTIEFVSNDVIRVYAFAFPDSYREASNNYFTIEKVGLRQFTITADFITEDTYGNFNLANAKESWNEGGSGLFQLIEISEDRSTLYYGKERNINYCYLNRRPQ